jgi:hypothetical protein
MLSFHSESFADPVTYFLDWMKFPVLYSLEFISIHSVVNVILSVLSQLLKKLKIKFV